MGLKKDKKDEGGLINEEGSEYGKKITQSNSITLWKTLQSKRWDVGSRIDEHNNIKRFKKFDERERREVSLGIDEYQKNGKGKWTTQPTK